MATKKGRNLVSTREAAEIAGVKQNKVIQAIRAGKLQSRKIGWVHIIKTEDLEEYIKNEL